MSLPLFVSGPGSLAHAAPGAALVLDGDEGRHAAAVRRLRPGEQLDVADGAGLVARCTVERAERDRLLLVVDVLREVPPRTPTLVLVQALAKGGRDELAVETATECGVDAVIPWQAERSVVQWSGDRGERSRRRWEATALAAAKQSRRATVPVVEAVVTTPGLAARCAAGDLLLVLHEDAAEPLSAAPLSGPPPPDGAGPVSRILLAVGPEGGISSSELAALEAAGGRAVRLGPEILRASSAGPAALAVLSARLGRW